MGIIFCFPALKAWLAPSIFINVASERDEQTFSTRPKVASSSFVPCKKSIGTFTSLRCSARSVEGLPGDVMENPALDGVNTICKNEKPVELNIAVSKVIVEGADKCDSHQKKSYIVAGMFYWHLFFKNDYKINGIALSSWCNLMGREEAF